MKQNTNQTQTFIDPVCMMEVDSGEKNLRYNYHMRTYYFCAEACRKAFAADPEKYVASKAPKRKGWWGRYLERLNKATGGQPPKCCH